MRLLSYNIQAGIGTQKSSDYFFKGYRQIFHVPYKAKTLEKIGEFLSDFDIVCLQEVDFGGRRSNFKSQLDKLQNSSGLKYVVSQRNRVVGKTSIHGNAILSRFPIDSSEDHKLPSRIPGRGKLAACIRGMTVVNTHLSLDVRTQRAQLEYISGLITDKNRVIVMGDMNCRANAKHFNDFARAANLVIKTTHDHKTYPSWKPKHGLDHILVSELYEQSQVTVHDVRLSDHLPVSIQI